MTASPDMAAFTTVHGECRVGVEFLIVITSRGRDEHCRTTGGIRGVLVVAAYCTNADSVYGIRISHIVYISPIRSFISR